MKLSTRTLSILKHFAKINNSIVVTPGNYLQTCTSSMSVLARAKIEEEFTTPFAIYNLTRFLGTLSLFDDPDLDFGSKFVTISSGKQRVNYTYADPSMIASPPSKPVKFPESEVEFTLTASALEKVVDAVSILQVPEIAIVGADGIISLRAMDSKTPTSDVFSCDVGETDSDFKVIFQKDNLKFISADYKASITTKGICRFETEDDLTFWVATQAK